MDRSKRYKIILEATSWAITALIALLAVFPIYQNDIDFPFYTANITFVVIFITFTRYLFLLKHTWLINQTYIKIGIIGISILLAVSLLNWLFMFNRYIDEEGLQELTYHLKFNQQMSMIKYIKAEMLFFGVGSVISAIAFPVRLMMSVWKDYNPDR